MHIHFTEMSLVEVNQSLWYAIFGRFLLIYVPGKLFDGTCALILVLHALCTSECTVLFLKYLVITSSAHPFWSLHVVETK